MDVSRILGGVPEPASTVRLQRWMGEVRDRLVPAQRRSMERWFNDAPFDAGALQAFRNGHLDVAVLSQLASRLTRVDRTVRIDENSAPIARIFEVAHERPAVASTLVWHLLGATAPELASHLIQGIRERARLPGLRNPIASAEIVNKLDTAWFEHRQIEDTATWMENIPTAPADTLADAIAQTEAQRAATGTSITELVPFVRQLASFLLSISTASLDPLGFALSSDAQLVADPPLAKRIEIATWARSAHRSICLRGQLMVMSIGVKAPWPLALEVITCELGRGSSGAFGILLRLSSDVTVPSPTQAPLFLCIPDEPIQQRGARFERWSQRAYPHAVDAWRGLL